MIDPNTEDQAVSAAPPSIQPVAVDYKLDASAKAMSLQEPAPTLESFEPPSQMADALRKSAEGMFNQSRQELNASIFQATSKNPDEEAAAQKLGAATGVGSGIALRNKNELERRKAMNDARNLDLTNNNPALANKLIADPQFAAVAHDDLSWWDKYGKLAHSVMFPAANPAWFAESVMQTSMGKAFTGGMQVPQITELQREQALSPNGELTPEKEQQLQALEAQQAQTQKETGGMLNTPASMAGNIVGMGESLAKYTTAGATIGGTAGLLGGPFAEVTVPGGIIAGGTSGFSAGITTEFSKQAMYANYRQSRLQGISHEQALINARIVGVANAVFNAGAIKLVGAPIGAAISSLAAPITESVVVPTAKAILIDYLKAYGLHEIGAFGLGAGLKASEIGAAKISGIKTTEGAMNIAEEILTSGVHTAYDFALLNALFPLLPAAAQYRVLKDSEMRQAKFKAKIKFVAENNKTKKRSPEQMQNGIESVTPESEQFVYVDRDQLNNVLMQSGASAKEIEQILPGVLAQLQAENPEIAINSAHYLANEVASTNIGKALEPNLRMEKGGLSPNEILQQNIDASRVRAESKAAVEQYAKMNAGFVESAQKVEDLYFNQLVAAGYKEQEARFHAAMIRDYYAVIAAREKKTPEQVQAERPYTIISEQQAREQQAAQAAQQAPAQGSFEQAAAPSSGVFDANNPPAPAKGERTIFAVMDYDGKIYYDRDATMHGDLVDTFPNIAESIIDGGFIIDGKYQMGMSEGGYSAFEGTDEQQSEVRKFTEQANTTTPQVLKQSAVPATAMPSVTTDNPVSPIGLAIASAGSKEVKSIEESDTFFKKVWKKLLIASGKQMRSKSDESVKEAAKLAVADIQDFVKNNPQFSDYYSQDWMKTRSLLDEYAGRAITDDEFQMYRVICGLTSPNTKLPSNISDTVKLWTHWMENGSFDGFLLGAKPITGTSVVFESDEVVSGTTANIKIRTVKIIARLVKELGSVKAAIDYLREPVTSAELNKVNKSLGYAGNVSNIGNIRALVKMATGQDKLIPRMFVFGQKVGAYTLNAVGDERFTTVDIWESRYIRSFFSGMFENEIGLPTDEKEHDTFVRFGYAFKDEMEKVTGRIWTPSSLQALRWFYIIAATRSAGYSKASTNETISTYTSRVLQKEFDYNQSRKPNATRSTTTPPRRIAPQKYERDIGGDLDAKGITDPKQRREYTAQAWIQFARSNSESDPMGFQFDTNRSGVPRGSGPLSGIGIVATHTPGSQLAKSLAKAGANIQPYVELAQTEVSAKAFSDRVRAINANSKFGTAVYVYSDAEYMGKRLFISESGKSGFALSSDGDIVSVFSEAGSREGRGAMALATQMGGTKLDCFDTVLPGYYAAHGFRAVARIKWNDEYTPTGWDFDAFAQFNGGRPDVVYMVYEANHFDSYSNTDGVVVADPSEAVAIQTQDIKTEQDRVAANKARDAEVIKPSQTLFQAAKGSPAGTYDPAKMLTTILKSGNKSTLIHETAHFFLHMAMDTASKEGSSLEAKQDAQVLLDWFGVKDIATWNAMTLEEQRQHHEAFALNWEIYVHEGKAPSVGLQKVFDAFSRYLKRVYVSIVTQLNEVHRKNFGVDLPSLTPEVKAVMDRMLANDAQISQREAIDNIKAQWETQEESGMNDGEWAALKEMEREAHDQAESDLNKASLKQVEWLTKATERLNTQAMMEFKRLRKTVSAEETAKMEKEPLRQAENFLKTGKMLDADGNEIEVAEGFKLDKSAVGAMYPTSTTGLAPAVDLGKLRGMTMDGGLAPDLVAEMFGLSSGDELIRKLVDQKPFKDELQERTDARMEDEHGDLNTEEARQDAANQALHNELRARYIAVQNRFRNKIKTPVAQLMIAVKERSQEILAKMKLKDIRPTEFSSAEAREAKTQQDAHKAMQTPEKASKTAYTRSYNEQIAAGVEEAVAVAVALEKGKAAAEKAQAKIDAHKEKYGDVMPEMVARKAGDLQELYNRLAKDAFDIKDSISRFVKYTKNVLSDDNRKRMGADASEQIEGILSRFGLVPPGKEPKMTLEQWVTQQTDKGLPPDIAPLILLKQYSMPFSEMTVEEFADLKDAVKYIEHVSKYEKKAMKAARNKSFADFVPLVVKSVLEQNPRLIPFARRTARTGTEKANEAVAKFGLGQQRGGMMIRILDGDKDGGIVSGFLLHTMDAQTGVESEFVTKTTKVLDGLIQPVLAEGKMGGSGELFPNLKSDAFPNGRSLNKEERLAIALNCGNESNLQRLLGGERWTMDQVVPILRTLTDVDWNFVEGVWDHFETYKPMVAELERKLNGKEPDWIEPKPFEIKTADGTTRTIKGGYYPVKFDPAAGPQAKIFEDVKDVKSASYAAHGASTTRRGYVKARVEEVHDKPLLLNMNGMYSGFAEVIHDLAWREWLIDANRFMANKEIDKAIRDKYGAPFVDGIRDWIKRIAGGTNSDNVGGVFNFFRHKAVASTMAWKVATLWKHAFDISKTASILGADKGPIEGWKYVFNSAGHVFSNYNEAIKEAFANSPELRQRFNTRFRELNEIKNAVAGQSKYDKFMYTHGLILHHMLWKVTDVWTWHAAAKKYIANGFTNEEAYAMANRALIDSQGSGTVGNLSAIEGTRSAPMKLFTALSHYMINTSNILYVKTKTRTPGAAGTAKLVADYLQAVTVPVIYEELMRHAIMGLLPNKKKKEEETVGLIMKEFALAHADYLLGSVPVAREFSPAIKEMFGVKTAGYQGPFGLKIIPDAVLFMRQAGQKEVDAEFRRAAIRLLGDGTGFPASQLNSTIDGVEALFKGETMNPLAPILGTRH